MEVLSIERQLKRIIAIEEKIAEQMSTVSRPVEREVIKSLDEHKMLAWEYTIPADRVYHAAAYFTRKVEDQRCCEHCNLSLPLADFQRVKYAPDGLAFWCNRCRRKNNRLTWADRVVLAGQRQRYHNGRNGRRAA